MKVRVSIKKHVVTVFSRYENNILVVTRSSAVGSYQGRWSGISGYLESGIAPLEQAYTELREETGLLENDLTFIKEAPPIEVKD